MSEQFTPEEAHPLDWLKDSSHLTNNHLSNFSELSKDHFLDDLIKQPVLSTPQITHQRNRSRINSKNYRDRRRGSI